jgi:hypothetical protein
MMPPGRAEMRASTRLRDVVSAAVRLFAPPYAAGIGRLAAAALFCSCLMLCVRVMKQQIGLQHALAKQFWSAERTTTKKYCRQHREALKLDHHDKAVVARSPDSFTTFEG